MLRDAANALQKNLPALALYMGIILITSAALNAAIHVIGGPFENPYDDPKLITYEVVLSLFNIFAAALAQAVAFSRIGKEIDRPLWKIGGDLDAMRRFFPLWIGLNSIVVLLNILTGWSHFNFGASALTATLQVLTLIAIITYVPIGAALMFIGTADWTKIVEAMKPLYRQFSKTLVFILLGGFLFFLLIYLYALTEPQPWLRPVLDFAFAYFDCLIFAGIWLICIYDRQNPEEVELDF